MAPARPREPSGLAELAFFHYPLYVDNSTEPSDTTCRGPRASKGLLHTYGVAMSFNGHAHVYQRNKSAAGGWSATSAAAAARRRSR